MMVPTGWNGTGPLGSVGRRQVADTAMIRRADVRKSSPATRCDPLADSRIVAVPAEFRRAQTGCRYA